MKRAIKPSHRISIIIVLCIIGWFTVGGLFKTKDKDVAPAKELSKVFSVQTQVSYAQPHTSTIDLHGKTEPGREVTVRAETDGIVENLYVEEGSFVKQGEKLISLKVDDREEKLKSAKALLKQRELEYQAAKKLANKNYRSKTALSKTFADLEKARADLKKAQIDLKNATIYAPFDGILNKYDIEIGDIVSEFSNTPLARFVELDPLVIVVHVEEKHYKHLEKGKQVGITLGDGTKAEGVISYISAVADKNTHTFRVEIKVYNPDFSIPAGVSASVHLPLKAFVGHQVPSSCLTLSDDGIYGIKTANDDNVVEFYPVNLMQSGSDFLWVTGMPDQTQVITVGHEFVKEGSQVNPVRTPVPDLKSEQHPEPPLIPEDAYDSAD